MASHFADNYIVSARKLAVLKTARDFGILTQAVFVKWPVFAARWAGFPKDPRGADAYFLGFTFLMPF